MKVEGPNGLVIDVPESIATGLVGDGSRGYRFVPEDKTETKTAEAPKPRRGRNPKAVAE